MKLTGLLGGSFNPAHGAHRAITLFAIEALQLDEAWWLVSPGNPLKPKKGMAPLAARVRSAQEMARRAPIKATAIERELGTVYTIDTLRALKRRFPRRRFIWLMGADNLAQFHLWKDWREIAAEMPIAVVARPGYDDQALASPAMAWLRRFRLAAPQFRNRGEWSAPALIELRFDPDPRSATEIRRTDPDWASRYISPPPRDGVTHSLIHDSQAGDTNDASRAGAVVHSRYRSMTISDDSREHRAYARPEHSGFSTIVSITDMPITQNTETGSIHALVMHQLDEDQAQDVVSIPLEGKSSIADHMVIASGRSTRQVAAMAGKLAERLKKEGHGTPRIEGLPAADWVLIDAGDVVVHLFRPEVRSFYNLERMWGFGDEAAAAGGRA